jgi:hypothetical protein
MESGDRHPSILPTGEVTIIILLTTTSQGSKKMRAEIVGIGTAIAVVVSWSIHHSILWAMLHGVFGWLYVIYYAITR